MRFINKNCKFILNIPLCFLLLFAFSEKAYSQESIPLEKLIISSDGRHFDFSIEIATTDEERGQGLMFRLSLPPYTGMLFNYAKAQPVAMWMKNTFIPLDILFIDENGFIVNIAENTTPQSLTPIPSASAILGVLEVKAGTSKALMIKVGDRIIHSIFKNAPQ